MNLPALPNTPSEFVNVPLYGRVDGRNNCIVAHAMIDEDSVGVINAARWSLLRPASLYATTHLGCELYGANTLMHRLILPPTPGTEIDHINGNGLDNRRENLRLATRQQNMYNRRLGKNNSSGYIGVSFNGISWVSQIKINGKVTYLGSFDCPEKAAHVYDGVAIETRGEFAQINFLLKGRLHAS